MVPSNPFGVLAAPRAFRRRAVPQAEAFGRPSMAFRSPSEFDHRDPAPSRRLPGKPKPAGYPASQTTLPLLGFFGPTTQCQTGGPVRPQRIPPPQRAAYGVWIPPSRTPPPVLPTLARWSVHGLHPSRVSPRRDRCPSRGPCPPDVTRRTDAPSKRRQVRRGRLQGLLPATSSCCHRNHKGSDRRSLPGVHPSRAYSRSTWRSLSSRRLPSRPQAALRLGPPGPQGIAA